MPSESENLSDDHSVQDEVLIIRNNFRGIWLHLNCRTCFEEIEVQKCFEVSKYNQKK